MRLMSRQWWNTPPNKSDWFFTRVRKTYQSLFPCEHKWVHKENTIIHGEDHGPDLYNRKCMFCGEEQYLVFHQYGNLRTEWISKPNIENWSFT